MVVCRTPKNNEGYQEVDEEGSGDIEYRPSVDSPSSWTTKSGGMSPKKEVCGMQSKATPGLVCSNVVLVLLSLTGIVYGALEITGSITTESDPNSIHRDESIGGLIIFGAIVGGAVSLMLVNLSWLYKGTHTFNLQTPCATTDALIA